MLTPFDFNVGKIVEFDYPSHNRLDLPIEYVRRRVLVTEYVDIVQQPIDIESFLYRPLVRRGSLLIVGIDQHVKGERRFWFQAMRDAGRPPSLRVGLYDPSDPICTAEWIGREFGPTVKDRLLMREALLQFRETIPQCDGLRLGLFPVRS